LENVLGRDCYEDLDTDGKIKECEDFKWIHLVQDSPVECRIKRLYEISDVSHAST
jgi:Zn-finger protein